MKKVFAILAVACIMTACNNGENKEVKSDTPPPVKVDSTATKVDTAAKVTVDTAKKAVVDTTKKK